METNILDDINLYGSDVQKQKAEKFNQLGKVKQTSEMDFVVEKIEGYNKKDKHIKIIDGRLICDCFYFVRYKKECSHILACKIFIKRSEWKRRVEGLKI
jgi:hypothetical protein